MVESPVPHPAVTSRSNIVEAALSRVKRASENASRAALPKIEPARPIHSSPQVGLVLDRQATALALEPLPEIESRIDLAPPVKAEPIQTPVSPPALRTAKTQPLMPERPRIETTVATPDIKPVVTNEDEPVELSSLPVIDELEPLDYLEAEVRKVDKALGKEFLRNESPSIVVHAVIGLVDLFTITLSASPFLAIIRIIDGNLASAQTRVSAGIIVALIAFFYLSVTQIVGGRTFGMMLTNTRVVDAWTFEPPSASRSIARSIGYFIAAAPALIGILWAAFNHKHRGWQDYLSGTVVVRDF